MTKYNLGCGSKILPGYANVDCRDLPGVDMVMDLSRLPWTPSLTPGEEIVAHDFLEHFPRTLTDGILGEMWISLVTDGKLELQVPDLDLIADVLVAGEEGFICSTCERHVIPYEGRCGFCQQTVTQIQEKALEMVYGGVDYPENQHKTGFTFATLSGRLLRAGFERIERIDSEKHAKNYGMVVRCRKGVMNWS